VDKLRTYYPKPREFYRLQFINQVGLKLKKCIGQETMPEEVASKFSLEFEKPVLVGGPQLRK